jgi:hypothetical protein
MWQYLTAYISGQLDFPEAVSRTEMLAWASKSITQQLNEYAVQGWELIDLEWISEREVMATFQRMAADSD